jgi:hypothetical protein
MEISQTTWDAFEEEFDKIAVSLKRVWGVVSGADAVKAHQAVRNLEGDLLLARTALEREAGKTSRGVNVGKTSAATREAKKRVRRVESDLKTQKQQRKSEAIKSLGANVALTIPQAGAVYYWKRRKGKDVERVHNRR